MDQVTGLLHREKPHGDGLGHDRLHQLLLNEVLTGGVVGHDHRVGAQGLDPDLTLTVDQALIDTECNNVRHILFPP